jgi:hypothetical protein
MFQERAATHQEHVVSRIVQEEAEAVVGRVDDPSLARVQQTVLQKHSGRSGSRDSVHCQDVAV